MVDRLLYVVRHGETEWNRGGRVQGHRDSRLTELGEAQARGIGRRLAAEIAHLDEFTMAVSPLGRTRRTAELIRDELDFDPARCHEDERLMEFTWGDWDGHTRHEIEEKWPGEQQRRRENHWHYVPPGGESYAMLAARLGDWLGGIAQGTRMIVVTHGAAGRVLRGLYAGFEPAANPETRRAAGRRLPPAPGHIRENRGGRRLSLCFPTSSFRSAQCGRPESMPGRPGQRRRSGMDSRFRGNDDYWGCAEFLLRSTCWRGEGKTATRTNHGESEP
ncbi:MAG: histidine phosphatase family protein [Alphaproteobacteria bacterium]|jgi:probable phosphoglycerate mutase|nr:histidine phosphatase family protein [Alphaproteobacteria bacterium]